MNDIINEHVCDLYACEDCLHFGPCRGDSSSKVITYSTRLDGDRATCLVKEAVTIYSGRGVIDSDEAAAAVFDAVFDLSNRAQELFCMMALDGSRRVKGVFEISRGTITSTLVHPREVYAPAMLCGAVSVIVAHNHPSGSLTRSPQDDEATIRLRDAGKLLGIELDDHIVMAGGKFLSIK